MPLELCRIDDRLIHGQVIVGWGNYLKPDRIILCNDAVAQEDWQREMFESSGDMVSFKLDISIFTQGETLSFFKQDEFEKEKIILIVESPREICELVNEGAPIGRVNVGGMHYKSGKVQIAPYIFVDDEDIKYFKMIIEKDIKLEGQDVPTAKKIDITELVYLI
ncbi:PTS sugar transporter subunit IIB [candidate division KSB1 bacterium]|nr:PTS sugar transporter subunit IIB [candidate division KSB1 bacterium]